MIVRVGIDLVEIARIEKAMRHPRFLERILTPSERAYCTTPARIAGRWAAKEAIAKCLGTHLSWHQVEIQAAENGKPKVNLIPAFLPESCNLHLSITHEKTHALAVAILENRDL